MNGLPAVPVHDLQIHPRDRELIAATHGRSIWIVDIAPLQDLTNRVVADGRALFEPKPAFQFGLPPLGGEFYAQAWFSRRTPGSEAEISYYIGAELAAELQAAFEAARAEAQAQAPAPQAGGQRPAAAPGGPGGPGGPAARQGGPRGPQVEITVTNAEGETVNTVSGPAEAGIHTVRWNFRRPQAAAPEPSPYERQERERVGARARVVADSLIAAGWDEAMVRRLTGAYTGETDPQALMRAFGGGGTGQQARDPEEFQERPAEQTASGQRAAGGMSQMREVAELILPGQGSRALTRMFRRGGGQAPVVEPGRYTLTLKAGDKTFTRTLTVERVGTFLKRPSQPQSR